MVTLSVPDGIAALRPTLRELAATAREVAPDEAGDLLRTLDRDPTTTLAGTAVLAAGLARLRARVLAAPGDARARWEDLFAAGAALRGPILDAFRAAPAPERERLIAHLRALDEADRLPDRRALEPLRDDEVLLAVAGDFKRGKSMLVNALLGRRLLPTRVAPATAIPAFIRHAPDLAARLRFRDGRPAVTIDPGEIERYACLPVPGEEDTVAYRDEIDRLEIEAPWGTPGVTLVDLPGLNEQAGRARMAWEALERADAVLVTLSATQLLAEDEMGFLQMLWDLGHRALIFAVNYADRLEDGEVAAVRARAARLLEPFGGEWGRTLFLVSARRALAARAEDDGTGADSDFGTLEEHLQRLVTDERTVVWQTSRLRQALARLEADEVRHAEAALDLRDAARRRDEELEAHARQLRSTERAQADQVATAEEIIAARLGALEAVERAYDDVWADVERDLDARCREETLPWVWQEAGAWLRERLIRAIRAVNPGVTPRPEGHLRIRVAPGLRVGRDGLYAFYRAEAEREWRRFTADAQADRRAALEQDVEEARQTRDLLAAEHAQTWPHLAAEHASLRATAETGRQQAERALRPAVDAALAISAALNG